MSTPCDHNCHRTQIECDPCFRLHSMVEWLRNDLTGGLALNAEHLEKYPIIRNWLEGKADAMADTLRHLEVWAEKGGDRPAPAVVGADGRLTPAGQQLLRGEPETEPQRVGVRFDAEHPFGQEVSMETGEPVAQPDICGARVAPGRIAGWSIYSCDREPGHPGDHFDRLTTAPAIYQWAES